LLRRRIDAAERVLDGRSDPVLSRIRLAAGDLAGASVAADCAVGSTSVAVDPAAAAEAHVAAAFVNASLRKLPDARRHADLANAAARLTREPSRVWRIAAETAAALAQCGVAIDPDYRRRLLRTARRLPDLTAARIRAALLQASPASPPSPPSPP